MKKIKILSFLLVLGFFIISCRNHDLQKYLNELNTVIPYVRTSGWLVINEFENRDKLEYQLKQEVEEKTYNLLFIYYKESKESLLLNHYYIEHFNISHFDSISGDYFFTEIRQDTLYSFKSNISSMLSKEFIVGEYYYKYKFNELNNGQKKYFENHRDSLINLRGNDLPELPGVE